LRWSLERVAKLRPPISLERVPFCISSAFPPKVAHLSSQSEPTGFCGFFQRQCSTHSVVLLFTVAPALMSLPESYFLTSTFSGCAECHSLPAMFKANRKVSTRTGLDVRAPSRSFVDAKPVLRG
jgi:hypothetical protein